VALLVTDTNGSRESKASPLCLSVCLSVLPDDISKTDAARTTKRDVQMCNDDSRKPIYFGVKRQKVKVTLSVSVFRLNAVLTLAAYMSYGGFSPGLLFAVL